MAVTGMPTPTFSTWQEAKLAADGVTIDPVGYGVVRPGVASNAA